ncbi:MAG: hypothetical protein LQ337_002432 [Flavoplaca oasis]|nr:MAG: hypothetical protein LQ337_002432 [Flavoplaca oasis]
MIDPELPHSFRKRKGKSLVFCTTEREKRVPTVPASVYPIPNKLSTRCAAISCSEVMPAIERFPCLLRIAPELREQIYRELLHDQPSSLLNVLLVNGQISKEVKPWIFKQPLAFDGQNSLYKWLALVDPDFLPDVVDVRMELHDLDPDQIVKALGERLARASISNPKSQPVASPYEEAFDREMLRIRSALSRFPKLRSFTLLENKCGNPEPPHRLLVAFAALILTGLPLVSFTMPHKVRFAMDQAQSADLRHLQITDYESYPMLSFPRFLEPLSQLAILEICNGIQSITQKDVGRNMYPHSTGPWEKFPALRELVLCMHCHHDEGSSRHYSTFASFDSDVLTIIQHAKSLEVLKVLYDPWIDRSSIPMQRSFSYIQSSSLSHIETSFWWTPLPHEYPKSVIAIAVRFDNHCTQFSEWFREFFDAIDPIRSTFFADHPHLKKIVLYLPSKTYDERDDEQKRRKTSKAQCLRHGVQLKVVYKDFRCEHRHRGPFMSCRGTVQKRCSAGPSQKFR